MIFSSTVYKLIMSYIKRERARERENIASVAASLITFVYSRVSWPAKQDKSV